MTSKFLGRTVHAEYDGYLRASSEQNIYDPWSGVRLHFEDCITRALCASEPGGEKMTSAGAGTIRTADTSR